MNMDKSLYDPLAMNLRYQWNTIMPFLDDPAPSTSTSLESIVIQLSDLLYHPTYTVLISSKFRPILSILCARWLDQSGNESQKLAAFALLLNVQEELFPIFATFIHNTHFTSGLLNDIEAIPLSQLRIRLLAYYRILFSCPHAPMIFNWSSTPLFNVLKMPIADQGVKCLAIHAYAIHARLSEHRRDELLEEYLGPIGGSDVIIESGFSAKNKKETIDGWILPLSETLRVQELRESLLQQDDYYTMGGSERIERLELTKITPHIADIEGILLLKQPVPPKTGNSFILTSAARTTLRALALRLSLRLPILLSSPPSGGKYTILNHLVSSLYPDSTHQLVSIHLADTSIDAKSLFGSYVSSTTNPGNFEWQDGVIVKAMQNGRWLVLEDIDRASSEVLGALIPILEGFHLQKHIGSPVTLEITGRPLVVAENSFSVFATRSVIPRSDGSFSDPSFLGFHKFSRVDMSPLTENDLLEIISGKYPSFIPSIATLCINVWLEISRIPLVAGVRSVGIHDLEAWCRRIDRIVSLPAASSLPSEIPSFASLFPNVAIREEIFFQARDIFFGAGAFSEVSRTYYEAVSHTFLKHLDLDSDRIQWIMDNFRPEMHLDKDTNDRTLSLTIGRIRLVAPPVTGEPEVSKRLYATHRSALVLLEKVVTCISMQEPVLLVGETGTGKTTTISYLSTILNRPLVSLNLSNQTESSDLLGNFKPVDAKIPAGELQQQFIRLFGITFSRKKNAKFEQAVRVAVSDGKWKKAVGLWKECVRLALEKIQTRDQDELDPTENAADEDKDSTNDGPRKRRKLHQGIHQVYESDWISFLKDVNLFDMEHVRGQSRLTFRFIEGPLVRALREGSWVLLDEVNLASSETLECISSILRGPTASLVLSEQGTSEPIPRHPDFRLFACMNPATDVGKKDLPMNIRTRFTEIHVPSPDTDKDALLSIVQQYIGHCAIADKAALLDVVEFYMQVKSMADKHELADGSNHRPHFSIRTLARALMFASQAAFSFGLRRALWEGCLMAFSMALEATSANKIKQLAERHLLSGIKNVSSVMAHVPLAPSNDKHELIGSFWIECGDLVRDPVPEYILTPSVRTKLADLARIIYGRRFPVLIEGPTSSGKTSAIEYLARRTGHRFVRINNHEHTDIQEYLGSYISDPDTGKLVFRDGMLVGALRNGDWIVLDELNLAPTDVLEALNRLLDDNRELFIPETQEVIRPHPHFMLFATQNPPGLYAGRKRLSRAFRNRFLEVHFDDVPQSELQFILSERCRIPDSYAKKIVNVFQELGKRRQADRVFEAKHGFATLRDLFRWGSREASTTYELAKNGYMILAERTRRLDDKAVVKEVIEATMKESILVDELYCHPPPAVDFLASSNIIWTSAMRRLYVLVATALQYNEPVLLVGETGSGKTSVCQLYASAISKPLVTLSCHQSTETSDLIGSQRPIRNRNTQQADLLKKFEGLVASLSENDRPSNLTNIDEALLFLDRLGRSSQPPGMMSEIHELSAAMKRSSALFEWKDGPLVHSMREGCVFLLDEVSLADDSVLERLNSVLEPSRSVVLAEKGGVDVENATVIAHPGFKLVATMNPGGDYGKKELSPALRNRFTEIWVPSIDSVLDLQLIIEKSWKDERLHEYTQYILSFRQWINSKLSASAAMSMRDILTVVNFMNRMAHSQAFLASSTVFYHAIRMACLDGLETSPFTSSWTLKAINELRQEAEMEISKITSIASMQEGTFNSINDTASCVSVGPFTMIKGLATLGENNQFNYFAPATLSNIGRLFRACQLDKPILLEGSPGVGKTSLVSAFAHIACQRLVRINLSDQTELIDLFGTDYPMEGDNAGFFAWKEAAFLECMRSGGWVLLDEMNLATQTVLEGLNAVLDHRGSVFIPELGQTFPKHANFRIFAAQNPLGQGGGRKGLPKSFLDRFTKVYIQTLTVEDMYMICRSQFPDIREDWLRFMVAFNSQLQEETTKGLLGKDGGPWEFNLRDVLRWASLLCGSPTSLHPSTFLDPLYLQRFRTVTDRDRVVDIFQTIFGPFDVAILQKFMHFSFGRDYIQLGARSIKRGDYRSWHNIVELQGYMRPLSAAGLCMDQGWLTIISGAPHTGKTHLVRYLAAITGSYIQEISLNNGMDTGDILGSFEQLSADNGGSVQFGWVDGPLLKAMKAGYWLVFDNANLCNPSVLDRLNSLCEPNGCLTLTEQGHVNGTTEVLYPHPNFRLILLIDPRNGELSRAMRNRGVEVHLIGGSTTEQDICKLYSTLRISSRISSGFDPEQEALAFEQTRRGYPSNANPRHNSRAISRPGSLVYDSALMTLWDNLTLRTYHGPQNASMVTYCASVDILVRYFRPTAFPLLRSYANLMSDKKNADLCSILTYISTNSKMIEQRACFETVTVKSLHVPLGIIAAQPLDILVCHEPWSSMNTSLVSPVTTFSTILGLVLQHHFLKSFIEPEQSFFHQSRLYYTTREKPRSTSLGVASLYPLYLETLSLVSRVTSESEPLSIETSKTLHQLKILLDFVEHLRDSAMEPFLNFSSAIIVNQWYLDALDEMSEMDCSALRRCLTDFSKEIRLTTGHGMHHIWKALTCRCAFFVDSIKYYLPESNLSMGICWFPLRLSDGPDSLTDIEISRRSIGGNDESESCEYSPLLAVVESSWVASIFQLVLGSLDTDVREPSKLLLDVAQYVGKNQLHRLGFAEQVSSMFDRNKDGCLSPISHVSFCLKLCLRSVNLLQDSRYPLTKTGPAVLLTPVLLRDVVSLCTDDVTFHNLNKHREGFLLHTRILLDQCRKSSLDRLDQLFALWMGSIHLLAESFRDTYPTEVWEVIHDAVVHTKTLGLASSLVKTSNHNLSQVMAKRIIPVLESLQPLGNKFSSHLARAWIELGTGLLELYLPDFPMDPLASENSTFDFLKKGEMRTSALLEFAEHAAETFFGDRATPLSSLLDAELRNIRNRLRKYPDSGFRVVDLSRLQSLFDEIRPFMHQFIFNVKFSNLVETTGCSEISILMQEISTICHSITGFLQRLDKGYTDLYDIVHPISVALLFIQFGLHLFNSVSEGNTSTDILSSSLIKFPTAAAVDLSIYNDLTPGQSLYSLLASSYKYVLENQAGADFVQLGEIFDKIAILWLRQNSIQAEQTKASQSLYRHKTLDNSSEDDLADFYTLFPSFLEESDQPLQPITKPHEHTGLDLSPNMKHIVYTIHQMVTCNIKEVGTFKKTEELFWQLRYDLLLQILTTGESLHELDRDSLPLRLSIIWKNVVYQPHQQASYNFYYDSNISETKKAFVIVSSLRDRLLELLREWPDQMILRHILDHCDIVLQLNVQSSVARVLSGLEKLVMQVADWESYANRENSLTFHQTAITDIIVSWRRIELSSWSSLFESETLKFETENIEWWARMYDLTVRGSLHAESLNTYLTEVISVIDEFISTSSLGYYRYRLQLVGSFAEYVRLLSKTHERFRRVNVVLYALHSYYLQFGHAVQRVINEKRKPLEKELQDYVKLASWKDTNVYALQQSAQRTHRQLYKCIRKFRDILKESVGPYLSVEEVGPDTEHSKDHIDLEFLPSLGSVEFPAIGVQKPSKEMPAYLVNLSKTFMNFQQIVRSSGQRFVEVVPYHRIEDFAIEILTTSTQLTSDTDAIGSDLKAHKVLFMRKKRAWVDLLQGLKHAGFSARIKPDILQRQTNRFWLLDHPFPNVENSRAYLLASKNKAYFNKLLVTMPTLRSSFSSHHSDVNTGELQRALNFVESSYSFFLAAYTRYCTDCEHYGILKRLTNRIISLSESRSDTSIEAAEDIRSWHKTCLGLQDALNELLVNCNRLTELHGALLLSSTVVESITSCLGFLKEDEESLGQLQQEVACLDPPLMNSDEIERLHSIRGRITAVTTSLRQWMEEEPRLQHFCRPIITWLDHSISSGNKSADAFIVDGESEWTEAKTIELLLLTAQAIRSQSQKHQIPNEDSELQGVALTCASYSGGLSAAFGIKNVLAGLESFLINVRASTPKDRINALQRVAPFLDAYLQLADPVLYLQATYVKASGKLTYVLARLILSISQKGFCKPPSETEEQQVDESNKGQLQDGTGFGEGKGKEDIGQEVGDESQVEGLRNEVEDNKGESDEKTQDNDEGIEMDGVDGETQDVDVDEESGSESEEPPDDIVEDLDKGDSEKIDEKLWEGEHEDDKQQSDQAGKDSKGAGKDTAAQTSEESKSSVEETLHDDNVPDGDNPADTDDNAPPIDAGKQLEQTVPEESVLDLPDDINIDQSEGGGSDGDLEDALGDEDQEVDEVASQLDAHSIGGDGPMEEEEGGPEDQLLPAQEDFQEQPTAEDNMEGTMEDSSRGNQGAAPNQKSTEDALMADDPTNAETADTAADSLQDNVGIGNQGLNQGTNMSSVDYGAMDVDQHDAADGEPIAMGDASKPIHRQWQDIDSADSTRPSVSNSNLPTRVEYVPESMEDPNDMQALGPARDKKPVATEDVQMLDEEETTEYDQSNEKTENVQLSDSKNLPPTANNSKPPRKDRPLESQADSREANGPTASDHLLAEAQMVEMIGDAPISEETVEQITKKWCEIGRPESLAGHVWRLYESLTRDLSFMLCEQLRLILAPTLATRLKGDYKTGKKLNMKKIIPYIASDYTKDKIWLRRTRPSQREYQILIALDDSRSMGESHSVHLAYETLALVTKALNRLEAGEIAIASFGETFELAHRFEDGMVGEREGEKLMKSFNFSQSKTDILGLMQASVDMLLEARERRAVSARGSSGDLWQLEIIISDGICQDHEQLRSALRMAEEHRILVVFIIIDSLHSQSQNQTTTATKATKTTTSNKSGPVESSILNMNQVSYQNINGKLELQLARYLDTFPFPYYLILREVEALPDVLANTLKQFFERISEQ